MVFIQIWCGGNNSEAWCGHVIMFAFAKVRDDQLDDPPKKEKRSKFEQLFTCSDLYICPHSERVYLERTDKYPSSALHCALVRERHTWPSHEKVQVGGSLPLSFIVSYMVVRAKIRSDWRHSIHLMDSSEPPACPGAVSLDEFHHVALTVALAISNPRKWLHLLRAFNMLIWEYRQSRMGCCPPCWSCEERIP